MNMLVENKVLVSNIRRLCEDRGISVNKMCTDIGISRSSVRHWENGSRPNYATITKIARYFNTTPGYICKPHISYPADKAERLASNVDDLFGAGAGELMVYYTKLPKATRSMALAVMKLLLDIATASTEDK